ncbi:MAG: GIY-YIG nuclease family protein [Patescibacteria group bacterium]
MKTKQYYVYIAINKVNTVFYTGVTDNLIKRRMYQHKNKMASGFTSRYNINKLVYYEIYNDPNEAIKREKQIKGGSRKKKIDLIKKVNPTFKDLYEEIIK